MYEWTTALRAAKRLWLGTSYPAVVERARAVVLQLAREAPVTLVADATGVGQAVVDLVRAAALPCELVPVTITAGETATRGRGGWNVPKRELMVTLQLMFARGELRIPEDLPLRGRVMEELCGMTRGR